MAVRTRYKQKLTLENITKAVDRYEERKLKRAGAFIMTTARRLIRKRRRASLPGKPPSSHQGGLRNNIFYADKGREVIVGPIDFGNDRNFVPQILEFGGGYNYTASEVRERQDRIRAAVAALKQRGRGKRRKRRSKKKAQQMRQNRRIASMGNNVSVTIAARPFMGAGLTKATASDRFQQIWGAV